MRQSSGAIVNVSSVATRGVNRVPYGAAKGGVNALTACLALETAGSGIRVNATALVTGAAQGIGRRVAERFLEEGAWLVA
ncbi:SDR family NAD(P)-dependent oxidoreductase, partial [Enterococcus faecalis]|uniref:SDR family NAD(P)-dependent oxidoreductase n=1 Tax=Enterococcus faecalis TaxID=1351 RepID=UPI003CC6B26F